jgi:hypothetical protein
MQIMARSPRGMKDLHHLAYGKLIDVKDFPACWRQGEKHLWGVAQANAALAATGIPVSVD